MNAPKCKLFASCAVLLALTACSANMTSSPSSDPDPTQALTPVSAWELPSPLRTSISAEESVFGLSVELYDPVAVINSLSTTPDVPIPMIDQYSRLLADGKADLIVDPVALAEGRKGLITLVWDEPPLPAITPESRDHLCGTLEHGSGLALASQEELLKCEAVGSGDEGSLHVAYLNTVTGVSTLMSLIPVRGTHTRTIATQIPNRVDQDHRLGLRWHYQIFSAMQRTIIDERNKRAELDGIRDELDDFLDQGGLNKQVKPLSPHEWRM